MIDRERHREVRHGRASLLGERDELLDHVEPTLIGVSNVDLIGIF